MSKVSTKQRYYQLTSWLDSFKKANPDTAPKKESRLSYYEKKGA